MQSALSPTSIASPAAAVVILPQPTRARGGFSTFVFVRVYLCGIYVPFGRHGFHTHPPPPLPLPPPPPPPPPPPFGTIIQMFRSSLRLLRRPHQRRQTTTFLTLPPPTNLFSSGNKAFSKQSFAAAEACYSRAAALQPSQPLALSNRALAVMNQGGRNQEALKVRLP
jgi:hypothetical protein